MFTVKNHVMPPRVKKKGRPQSQSTPARLKSPRKVKERKQWSEESMTAAIPCPALYCECSCATPLFEAQFYKSAPYTCCALLFHGQFQTPG